MGYPSRRSILSAGLLLGAAAAGGAGYRGWQRGSFAGLADGPAYAPWRDWRDGVYQGPLGLVSAAVLAASPHNSQPWRFRVEPQRLQIRADMARTLGPLDPFRRELHIGLGCAVENLMVAARGHGYQADLDMLPDPAGEPNLAAQVTLGPGAGTPVAEPHLAAMLIRHTHRGAYQPLQPLTTEVQDALAACVEDDGETWLEMFPAASERGRDFVAGTVAATERIVADDAMRQASRAWFRQTRQEIDSHCDGVSLATSGLSALEIRVAMALPDIDEARFGTAWIDATRDVHCASAAMFGLIGVHLPRDRAALMRAGRLWQRLHLEAALRGVAMQPLNQMMEVVDRDRQFNRPAEMAERLAAVAGDPGWTAVFAFRAGYAPTRARPSPRRGVALVAEVVEAG